MRSHLEAALLQQIALVKLPAPEREARLVPGRRFTCDFVWRDQWLVVEVEGGIWATHKTRHVSGTGFERDSVKYNELTLRGFRVLRVTERQIKTGQALEWIERALKTWHPMNCR